LFCYLLRISFWFIVKGHELKKLLAIGVILLSNGAWADWIEFARTVDGDVFYVDPATKKSDGRPRVWFRQQFEKPIGRNILSAKVLQEADCSSGRISGLATHFFSDKAGKILQESDNSPTEWRFPLPESAAVDVYIYLCGKAP